jgi:SAM-dependent methyltransferase
LIQPHHNEETFAKRRTLTDLSSEGWSDPGERAATLALADRVRGGRILDIGIGTGRTTSLLRLLSEDYVGIDYVPEMVEAARLRHPTVDLRYGDARDLSSLPAGSFDLVSFSYNGIDAVGHDDRQLILSEIHRVLRPGGQVMFSTLNEEGPASRQVPWRRNEELPWQFGSLRANSSSLRQTLRTFLVLVRRPGDPVRGLRNWLGLRRQREQGLGWKVAPMAAHQFGLLVHFSQLTEIRRELAAHHFAVEHIYGSDSGQELPTSQIASSEWWFHVIAAAEPDAASFPQARQA